MKLSKAKQKLLSNHQNWLAYHRGVVLQSELKGDTRRALEAKDRVLFFELKIMGILYPRKKIR